MSDFPHKQFEGTTYTFEHLQPISIPLTLNIKGQTEPHKLNVDVTFGCHCFTEVFDPAVHGDHHRYVYKDELRAFDTERFECSLQLPAVMASLTGGLIYNADESYTYVARIPVKSKGETREYSVFFSLRKPKHEGDGPPNRLILFVKSAYLAPLKAKSKSARNWRFKGLVCEVAGIG